jgi:hypothetical protein
VVLAVSDSGGVMAMAVRYLTSLLAAKELVWTLFVAYETVCHKQ